MRLSRVIRGLLRFLQFDGRANVQAATGEQKAHTYENGISRSLRQIGHVARRGFQVLVRSDAAT